LGFLPLEATPVRLAASTDGLMVVHVPITRSSMIITPVAEGLTLATALTVMPNIYASLANEGHTKA
jgi:hypothetical protein